MRDTDIFYESVLFIFQDIFNLILYIVHSLMWRPGYPKQTQNMTIKASVVAW